MNLFEQTGVILIAFDEKFTLSDPRGQEIARSSVHAQFLELYYNQESGHMADIENAVLNRNGSMETHVVIGDKTFVLFAYSKLKNRDDCKSDTEQLYSFELVENSLQNAFKYCKQFFPNEIIKTIPLGTGVQNDRSKVTVNSLGDSESWIQSTANEMGVKVQIIKRGH